MFYELSKLMADLTVLQTSLLTFGTILYLAILVVAIKRFRNA